MVALASDKDTLPPRLATKMVLQVLSAANTCRVLTDIGRGPASFLYIT